MTNTLNKTNDMDTLIKLHNKGLLDDSAFTKAVKKLNEKVTSPLDVHDSDVPFTQRDIDPSFGQIFDSVTGKKWVAKEDNMYKATFTPTQRDDKVQGLYVPDPFSGSILKKSESTSAHASYYNCGYCGEFLSNQEYHDCKKGLAKKLKEGDVKTEGDKKFVWNGYRWCDCSEDRESRLTDEDWNFAMVGILDLEAEDKPTVEVVVYSENRYHVPEHAKEMLEKFDEIWGRRVDEYNKSKDKWVRTVVKDEDGKEIVEWVEKPPVLKDYPSEVFVEGDDADINGLRHIFRLDIDEGDC